MAVPATPTTAPAPVRPDAPVGRVAAHPVLTVSAVAIGLTVPLQLALLVTGHDVFPGKAAELVFLTGTAALVSGLLGGRTAVRRLFAGLIRWRIGVSRWALVLLAMPVLTVVVGALTGTLSTPPGGWLGVAGGYALLLVLIGATGSLWEETAWAGFVQRRLINSRGLLVGSLLTAVPFGLIHLPLAFEGDGWAGTTWTEALINWSVLLGTAPFLRYLAGILLVDTRGSVLAVAVLHASFNAAGAMSAVIPGGWQQAPALVLLTLGVALHRRLRGRSLVAGQVDPASPSSQGEDRP
jgi:membrane protease YdiL (CAAX protease family)